MLQLIVKTRIPETSEGFDLENRVQVFEYMRHELGLTTEDIRVILNGYDLDNFRVVDIGDSPIDSIDDLPF